MATAEIARIIFALGFVVILMGGGAWAAQKLGLMGGGAWAAQKLGLMGAGAGIVRKRRLGLVESLPIDAKRRAAIIRCDGAEHLIILNQNSATVIARNIGADTPGAAPSDGDLLRAADESRDPPITARQAADQTADTASDETAVDQNAAAAKTDKADKAAADGKTPGSDNDFLKHLDSVA